MERASEREWTDGRRVEKRLEGWGGWGGGVGVGGSKTSSATIGSFECGETSITGARDSKKAEAISDFSAGQAAENWEQSGGQAG